jgi:hypothetical protein
LEIEAARTGFECPSNSASMPPLAASQTRAIERSTVTMRCPSGL